MNFKYPLATSTWDEKEYAAIQRVIDSNMFTMGARVAEFERDFGAAVGSKHAVMVNSGSSANLIMIAALFYTKDESRRLKSGDEVIVPAVSWSTTYYPLHQYGLKIKFVDIDINTLNIDTSAVRAAISPNTKAIFAVNLLGNPCQFDEIKSIAKEHSLVLIEDNCESLGATFDGKKAGTHGLMGSFSTFFSHHIATMEGGVVCTDDEELYHILLCLRAHGWTRNLPEFNKITGKKDSDPFKESFKFVLPGYNLRPLEMEGALGIEQVKKLPTLIEERRKNGEYWTAKMKSHPDLMIQRETGESSWFGFSLVIQKSSHLKRTDLVKTLQESGFECRPIVAGNFAKNPVVQHFNHEIHGNLENADWIDTHGLFIGNHHYPIIDAIDAVADLRY